MAQANSQVKVSIVAQLGANFSRAFTEADKQLSGYAKTVRDTNRAISDVSAYRAQQEAVKKAGYGWQAAKAKAEALRKEIAAQGAPTKKQASELARLEKATERASAALSIQRAKLSEIARGLQQAGINTGKLTDEQQRLTAQLGRAQSMHDRAEKSLKRQQAIVRGIGNTWQGVQRHAAGAMGAGAVIGAAGRKALPYDEQLARLADTASAGGGDFAGSKAALSKAVQDALKAAGGGTREEVLAGLNTLIATGGMSTKDAVAMIPMVAKGAFASGTGGADIASLALRMRDFGIAPDRGLNIAMRSGQLGGVELRDMARFLPEQMAAARSAGYSGEKGLAAITSMNQVALGTAGDPEQAANNVTNLLNKLASPELAKNIDKVAGVRFDDYALKRSSQGVFKAEAFAELADKQMMKDPKYRALRKQAESAKGGERGAIIGNMASIMEGSGMGQLIQDRQALAAALALMFARRVDPATGKSAMGSMVGDTLSAGDVIGQSSARLGGETFAGVQRAAENINAANEKALNDLRGPIDAVIGGFNSMTDQFPKLTSAAYAATVALGAIAAYGIAGGVVGKVLGGGAAAGGGAAGAAAASRAGRLRFLGRAGAAGLLSFGATEVGEATGILKPTDEARGAEAFKKGNYLEASRYMSAGSFIGSVWDKATGSGADTASKAADAAKMAQNRPNVTNNSTYNLTVQQPANAGAVEMAAQLEKTLREMERKKQAERRSSMVDSLGY